jgi:hypothetical protein
LISPATNKNRLSYWFYTNDSVTAGEHNAPSRRVVGRGQLLNLSSALLEANTNQFRSLALEIISRYPGAKQELFRVLSEGIDPAHLGRSFLTRMQLSGTESRQANPRHL